MIINEHFVKFLVARNITQFIMFLLSEFKQYLTFSSIAQALNLPGLHLTMHYMCKLPKVFDSVLMPAIKQPLFHSLSSWHSHSGLSSWQCIPPHQSSTPPQCPSKGLVPALHVSEQDTKPQSDPCCMAPLRCPSENSLQRERREGRMQEGREKKTFSDLKSCIC